MTRSWLRGVPGAADWRKVRPASPVGPHDETYEILTHSGRHLLLCAADAGRAEEQYAAFNRLERFQALGFPMPRPVDFGLTGGHVYQLLTWVEGERLTAALPGLPDATQYRLGQDAGRALAAIHSVPLEPGERAAASREASRRLSMLNRYRFCGARMAGDEAVLRFVSRRVTPPRRLACLHGGFHTGSMVITPEGKLGLVDLGRSLAGDRWQDFESAQAVSVLHSLPFVNGQLDGYFGGEPPAEFWEAFAYHTACGALARIEWAARRAPGEVRRMQLRYAQAVRDFRGFTPCEPPRWYRLKME